MKFWTLAFALLMGCTGNGTGIVRDNDPDDLEGDEIGRAHV